MKYLLCLFLLLSLGRILNGQVHAYAGEVRVFSLSFAPTGWAFCNGQSLSTASYPVLFSKLGYTYGGSGSTFKLPNLNGRVAIGSGQGPGLSNYPQGSTGGSSTVTFGVQHLPEHSHDVTIKNSSNTANSDSPAGTYPAPVDHNAYQSSSNSSMASGSISISASSSAGSASPSSQNNYQPGLGLNYCICLNEISGDTPLLGEIRMYAGTDMPPFFAECDGTVLSIQAYTALFSVVGPYYGGNVPTTFALPDMRGRVPIGEGSLGASSYTIGSKGGDEFVDLTVSQMAPHSHSVTAKLRVYDGLGNSDTPVNNYPAINPRRGNEFATTASSTSNGAVVPTGMNSNSGGSSNMQPYGTLKYIICTDGTYPSRN